MSAGASRVAVPISPVGRCIPYLLELMPHLTESEAKCTPHLITFIIIVRGAAMTAPSVKTQCKQLEMTAVEKRTFDAQYITNDFSILLHTHSACCGCSWALV